MSPPVPPSDRSADPSSDRSRRGSRDRSRRAFLRAGGGLVGAVGLAGCVLSVSPYSETVERSFDPEDARKLVVRNESGDVTLSAGDGDTLSGTVRKESSSGEDALDDVTVEASFEADRVIVAPRIPEGAAVTVDLDLAVPSGLTVLEVTTDNGDVSVTDLPCEGRLRTENGDVDVEGIDGSADLRSTNGDVSATGGGVGGAQTTNGDIDIEIHAMTADAVCRSTNGDVAVAVPEDLSAALRLVTSNGDADIDGVPATVDSSGERRIEGRLGEGEPEHTLTLRSTNGDVTLRGL
ncbi:DUF4097 family beta strand repeat-containing protein [Halosimplex halophilum]|uniref:DUF4097 family beta strand repeat-containing protein n=1 Tax=Halosimplex halophilum TaxID=2559572 RepID=UPI00107F7715|nr:DUF4097 family beta strand repeat-containing protein [Halosimplex halophilum]